MLSRLLTRVYRFGVCLVFCGLLAPGAQALTQDQTLYLQAMQAIRSQRTTELQAIRAQLGNYPLASYIDYYSLYLQPDTQRLPDVIQFIGQDPQGLLAGRLKAKYLRQLAGEQKWPELLQLANGEPISLGLKCLYFQARLMGGDKDLAYQFVDDIWVHNASHPGECSPLFALWKDAGLMTADKVWQRMLLVFPENDSDSLLQYLSNQLQDSALAAKGALLVKLYQKPQNVLTWLPAGQDPDIARMAALALQRLATQDGAQARSLYLQARSQYALNSDQSIAIEGAIARRFLLDRNPDERNWIDEALRRQHDPALMELRLRMAVWENDWQGVRLWVQRIQPEQRSDVRWTYWLARAEEALDRKQHALALYRQASYDRSYYGFLAADRLGVTMPFNPSPLLPPLDMAHAQARWSAVSRVQELLAIGETDQARAEWNFLMDAVSPDEKLQLGAMALQNNWFDLAILSSISAKAWDVLELRFPMPMANLFTRFAKQRGISPSLLYALARQESAMYHKAQSQVGATGLMQLMPTTAAHVANKLGTSYAGKGSLTDPAVNIELGSAYIKELLDNYSGNRVLAAAAYNAGPGRVRQWRQQAKAMDVWVENIPYKETRNYVQNVLVYDAIYQQRMHRTAHFLTAQERKMQY